MEWITTSTMLQKLHAADDHGAWERLVQRFQRPIVRFATRVGASPAEAEDVAQETLLAFAENYRNGKYDRAKGRLSHWLFGIAYRQIRREIRRQARRVATLPATGNGSFWSALPDQQQASTVWDAEWEQALLAACIERAHREFEPRTFRMFELAVRLEWSPADVARELAVPVKAVYNAKHRVIKRIRELRAELEQVGRAP